MYEYHLISDDDGETHKPQRSKKYRLPVSENIYCFDIEVASLFKIDGKWQRFNYDISQDEYSDIDKAAVPYIWQFGINDKVYYGRELWDFREVLERIASPNCYKVIWVHNLSYEWVFLYNILKDYTIESMVAREVKKPIEFRVKELNLIFRCSYMLTNLSLESAAKEYTSEHKKVGLLDYNREYSPLCRLSDDALLYAEYDIIVLREVIKAYLKEYEFMYKIPLTSTGTVRQALKDATDVFYIKRQQKLVPDGRMFLMLWAAFSGGYTHTNILHSSRYFMAHTDGLITSFDIASSYASVMVTEKYPCSHFMECDAEEMDDLHNREKYAFLIKIKITRLKSRYYNHYLQYSHVVNGRGRELRPVDTKKGKKECIVDNGRIVSIKKGVNAYTTITDIDLDILKHNYDIEYEVKECYKAKKDYLDVRVIKFLLGLYNNKTSLKNIEEMADIYRRDKSRLSGCFGMGVTNQLKSGVDFDGEFWTRPALTEKYINKKIKEMKNSYSTLFPYSTGVWICAYGRRNIYLKIALSSRKMDRDLIYIDTDSAKIRNPAEHEDLFLSYNLEMVEKYRNVIERYPDDLTLRDFMPLDKKGKPHPIGFFEFDGCYTQFVALGAKKYCYRDFEDGKLHITVSGVSKKGAKALNNDIRNFKNGFIWDYYQSGKMTHMYHELCVSDEGVVDNLQSDITYTDIDGNEYTSTYRWSIVLMPTTYTMGITGDYENLIELFWDKERSVTREQ